MKLFLVLALSVVIFQSSYAKAKKSELESQLLNFEILQQLVKSSSTPLEKLEGCSSFAYQDSRFEIIKKPNLGHFLSWNLSIFSQKKIIHHSLLVKKC